MDNIIKDRKAQKSTIKLDDKEFNLPSTAVRYMLGLGYTLTESRAYIESLPVINVYPETMRAELKG